MSNFRQTITIDMDKTSVGPDLRVGEVVRVFEREGSDPHYGKVIKIVDQERRSGRDRRKTFRA